MSIEEIKKEFTQYQARQYNHNGRIIPDSDFFKWCDRKGYDVDLNDLKEPANTGGAE